MRQFIGTQILLAAAMTSGAFDTLKGRPTPDHDDPNLEGYSVQHECGCQIWYPKGVFEKAYRPTDGMNFGLALEALKKGARIARAGWNGKNMFLFLLAGGTVPTKAINDPALRTVIEAEVGGETFEALGSIRMFTADKKILTGWLASQTDMLADDWQIV